MNNEQTIMDAPQQAEQYPGLGGVFPIRAILPATVMIPGCQHSEQYDKILPALIAALPKIKPAEKNRTNTFHHNKYADLSSVMEEVKGPLAENGLAVMQPVWSSDSGTDVKVNTVIIHTSGQWISSSLSMKSAKTDPQGVGIALTYARRYSLSGMLGLVADEDDDGNTASGLNGGNQPQQRRAPEQRNHSTNKVNSAPAAAAPKTTPEASTLAADSAAVVVDPEVAKKAYDQLKETTGDTNGNVIREYYNGCWEKRPASGSPEYLTALQDANKLLDTPEKIEAFKADPKAAGKAWADGRKKAATN